MRAHLKIHFALHFRLLHQKAHITAQDVEDSFDGNICRCTGYRPILDAMKSFSEDAHIPGRKSIDIEVKHRVVPERYDKFMIK